MAARCSSSSKVTVGHGKACFQEGVAPRMAFLKNVRAGPPLPSQPGCLLELALGAPGMQPSHLLPSALLPAGVPCLSTLQARGVVGAAGRPCHLDTRQTACSDVTSHSSPEVSATSRQVHQETGNTAALGDTLQRPTGLTRGCQIKKKEQEDCFQRVLFSGHDFEGIYHQRLSHLSGSGL